MTFLHGLIIALLIAANLVLRIFGNYQTPSSSPAVPPAASSSTNSQKTVSTISSVSPSFHTPSEPASPSAATSSSEWIPISAIEGFGFTVQSGRAYFQGAAFPNTAVPSTLLIAASNSGGLLPYAKDDAHVFYLDVSYLGNNLELHMNAITPIVGADPKTFTVLYALPMEVHYSQSFSYANTIFLYQRYAADKERIYYQGYPIFGADPSSFHIIFDSDGFPSNFDKDANHVFLDNYDQGQSLTLPNYIDQSTFKVIDRSGYIMDAEHVYDSTGAIISNDPQQFVSQVTQP